MKLSYLGHSSFLLDFGAGERIVTDPYGGVGFPLPRVRADAVTVSHGHYDHCNVAGVDAPLCFSEAGDFRLGGVELRAVPRYHDEVRGKKRGNNLVFTFCKDGLSVCHLGDLGEPCTEEVLRTLPQADILLLPVGGNYTIGAKEAKKYLDALRPAVAIPMHFKVKGLRIDISDAEEFLRLAEKYDTERSGAELELTKETLPAKTKIIVMERL